MKLLKRMAQGIVPVTTTEVDMENKTLETHVHIPGMGDYNTSTDLMPLIRLVQRESLRDPEFLSRLKEKLS